jgi:hypothetical protein
MKMRIAKQIMTFVLFGGIVLSFLLDWSRNHLLNPLWRPHARFHGALLLFFLGGVSARGIWLLWRRSPEPEVGIKTAMFISVSYWTPLFYIPVVLPSSTWWAGDPGAVPRIKGTIVYPNLVVAALFLTLIVLVYLLSKKTDTD